jgi:hypothetical protein
MIALQEFSSVIGDFKFDMIDETQQLSVTYGEKGKKWIKRIKKIDPFWNENLFISNLFVKSMENAIEKINTNENLKQTEDELKENDLEEVKSEQQ